MQEHERAVGGWQANGRHSRRLTLVTSGALAAIVDIAEGLEVDVERMRGNLELSGGLIMAEAVSFALAAKIGRPEAHKLVEELTPAGRKSKRPLKDVVVADARVKAHLSTGELGRLFVPSTYQGTAQVSSTAWWPLPLARAQAREPDVGVAAAADRSAGPAGGGSTRRTSACRASGAQAHASSVAAAAPAEGRHVPVQPVQVEHAAA